jgi:hypothetical protein
MGRWVFINFFHSFFLSHRYSVSGFNGSQEGAAARELLQAFQNNDDEALKKVTAKQVFNFLDNEVQIFSQFPSSSPFNTYQSSFLFSFSFQAIRVARNLKIGGEGMA